MEIPVYCMEQGRWQFNRDQMSSAPQHSSPKLRRRAREVEARVDAAGGHASPQYLREEQGAVWNDVAETMSKLGAHSGTGSLDAAYAQRDSDISSWMGAFPLQPDQVGLVAFAGDAVLGMDVIGAPRLYGRLHERLMRGYILDAMERRAAPAAAPAAEAQRFLDSVRTAARASAPTVGAGTYNVLRGKLVGGELLDPVQRVAHLSAFAADDVRRPDAHIAEASPLLARPSTRHRHRQNPNED